MPGLSARKTKISIHAPLTGSDYYPPSLEDTELAISIHAPLTGSDLNKRSDINANANFNPRSPYGERLIRIAIPISNPRFQSTLPLRGATIFGRLLSRN